MILSDDYRLDRAAVNRAGGASHVILADHFRFAVISNLENTWAKSDAGAATDT